MVIRRSNSMFNLQPSIFNLQFSIPLSQVNPIPLRYLPCRYGRNQFVVRLHPQAVQLPVVPRHPLPKRALAHPALSASSFFDMYFI